MAPVRRLQSPRPSRTVAAGVVLRGREVLVSRRLPGTHLEGSWEFPGGKVHPGEPPEAALRRELDEEVGLSFHKAVLLDREEHDDGEVRVSLLFYLVLGARGEARPREGQEVRWVEVGELRRLATPPANARVLALLAEQLAG